MNFHKSVVGIAFGTANGYVFCGDVGVASSMSESFGIPILDSVDMHWRLAAKSLENNLSF